MTAIEWLLFELSKNGLLPDGIPIYIHNKAKEMEKEEKIEFAKHFLYKCKDLSIVMAHNQVEQELIKYELNKSK